MLPAISLNSGQLKILACLFMLIDHAGVFLFPEVTFLRILGRLAFPIFAYFIAEGAVHTSSNKKYLLRLGIFALLFQWLYALAFETESWNIFCNLFLGLLAIVLTKHFFDKRKPVIGLILSVIVIAFGEAIEIDYGWYSIALCYFCYLFREKHLLLFTSWLILNIAYAIPYFPELPIQIFSLLAFPLLLIYNGERGTVSKWFFYGFYILHIPVLWCLKALIY